MERITIHMKDGTKREFKHKGRPGGSYTISIKYEGNFAIVEDEWQSRTAFPSDAIERIEEVPGRY